MQDKPVNLNFFTIAFPITAIVSILHRISGLSMLIFIPWFLAYLQGQLFYPGLMVITRAGKAVLWLGASALIYHLIAGIRHIIMDCGFAESKQAARISAYLVISFTTVVSLLLGHSLW